MRRPWRLDERRHDAIIEITRSDVGLLLCRVVWRFATPFASMLRACHPVRPPLGDLAPVVFGMDNAVTWPSCLRPFLFEVAMRVKLFWKNDPLGPRCGKWGQRNSEGNATELESQVNSWLAEHPGIRVVDIRQSTSGGSFAGPLWLLSVWYEEPSETSWPVPDPGP